MTYKVDAVPVVLPSAESLTVEFKSDRNGYPDRELIGALTCLANTLGGELWLGVEDDGSASGLYKHRNLAHLAALIATQTRPPLTVEIQLYRIKHAAVAKITVPQSDILIATHEGAYLQRRLKPDNTPECIHISAQM